jgi:hypothetical protein
LNVFFCFIYTCNIRKCGFNLVFTEHLCFAFRKTHWATATTSATLHLAHKKDEYRNYDKKWNSR